MKTATNPVSGTRYLFADHLGSPRLVTDETGQIVAYHKYAPFGRELTQRHQDNEAIQFTGHERDRNCEGCAVPENDDLDYMHARYYQAALGPIWLGRSSSGRGRSAAELESVRLLLQRADDSN